MLPNPLPEAPAVAVEPVSAGHTPGPWSVASTVYDGMLAEIVAERGLAQVWTGPRAMADARLIAAAPDLLAACEAVLEDNVALLEALLPGITSMAKPDGGIAKARAAIAKATGQ